MCMIIKWNNTFTNIIDLSRLENIGESYIGGTHARLLRTNEQSDI